MSKEIDWSAKYQAEKQRASEASDEEVDFILKTSQEAAESANAAYRAAMEVKTARRAAQIKEQRAKEEAAFRAAGAGDLRAMRDLLEEHGPPWEAYHSLKRKHDKLEKELAVIAARALELKALHVLTAATLDESK